MVFTLIDKLDLKYLHLNLTIRNRHYFLTNLIKSNVPDGFSGNINIELAVGMMGKQSRRIPHCTIIWSDQNF